VPKYTKYSLAGTAALEAYGTQRVAKKASQAIERIGFMDCSFAWECS